MGRIFQGPDNRPMKQCNIKIKDGKWKLVFIRPMTLDEPKHCLPGVPSIGEQNQPRGEAKIGDLPVEILDQILILLIELSKPKKKKWISEEELEPYNNLYTPLLPLSLVCKRFNHIIQGYLYQAVEFPRYTCMVPACPPVYRFYRTMNNNPDLRSLCKSFKARVSEFCAPNDDGRSREFCWCRESLCYDNPYNHKYFNKYHNHYPRKQEHHRIMNELLPWLTNLRSLDLQGGFKHAYTWASFINAIDHMPLLEELTLTSVYLSIVSRDVNLPQLRKLTISNALAEPKEVIREGFVVKDRKGTATFTTVVLSGFKGDCTVLAEFLTWPEALEHFVLYPHYEVWESAFWNPKIYKYSLLPHRSSLKSIKFATPLNRTRELQDFMHYPNAKEFHLCVAGMNGCNPEAAAYNIAALQHLQTVVLDWTPLHYDRDYTEPWETMQEREVDWIRRFALQAIASEVAVRRIRVIFNPDPWCLRWLKGKNLKYPWGLLEEVAKQIRPGGIDLLYEPVISKEEFYWRVELGDCYEDSDEEKEEEEFSDDDGSSERSGPEEVDDDSYFIWNTKDGVVDTV